MRQAIRERNPKRFAKRAWPWIALVVAAIWFQGQNFSISNEAKDAASRARATAAQVKVLTAANHALVKGIQNAITAACEVNGNSLRKVIREGIREGITDPDDPRLKELLPDASPQRVREIVEEGNAKRRERLKKAHPVNCTAVYKHFQLP